MGRAAGGGLTQYLGTALAFRSPTAEASAQLTAASRASSGVSGDAGSSSARLSGPAAAKHVFLLRLLRWQGIWCVGEAEMRSTCSHRM